jgi:lysophospholipase L1-like esterase
MEQFSPEVRGELMRSMGLTRREGRLATAKSLSATINPDTSTIQAGGNQAQALENQKNQMFASSAAAAKAAQISYDAAIASMKTFETFAKPMESIANTMHKVEISLFESAAALAKMAQRGMSSLP